jgi:hypothetical protein
MQPDSIKPVARSPSFTLSDDISNSNRNTFPNRRPSFFGARLRAKRDDSVKWIIAENSHNSSG